MPHYITKIDEMLPGAKIIKLTGYANGNQEYQKAKTPVCKWKDSQGLDDLEINKWINQGGWIGAVIPQERIIIDVDDQVQGNLSKICLKEKTGITIRLKHQMDGSLYLQLKRKGHKTLNRLRNFSLK